MTTTAPTALPVFVYGTLRPGQSNHHIVQTAATESVTAHGHQLQLHTPAHRGFPYATRGDTHDSVVGELLVLDPTRTAQALRRLDQLEGFHPDRPNRSHYVRREHTFTTDHPSSLGDTGTTVTAWIYLAGPHVRTQDLTRATSGDWLKPIPLPERTPSVRTVRRSPTA